MIDYASLGARSAERETRKDFGGLAVNRLWSVLGIVIVLATGKPSPAQKKEAPPKNVKVTVVVILASETGDDVDSRLKMIAQEVQKLNPNLRSFKLASMNSKSLAPDEKAVFELVENKTARVVVKHGADSENRVSLAITPPDQGEIVYRSACGKFLPIVTRYQTKARERLILAVRLQPCNGR
jgi:hypothetical protein